MRISPVCVMTVFEAATLKINHFSNGTFQENMDWIQEIRDAAKKAFGSASITLLPKTPSMKRKRPNIKKANNSENISPNKYASTFVDGGKTKKLKIDDMSAISENGISTIVEDSILDETNTSVTKKGRQLRARKKKTSIQPMKRSKRLAAKTASVSYVESPMEFESTITKTSSKTLVVEDTPSPGEKTMTLYHKSSEIMVSPIPHNVQPRVAALIEQLKLTAQKSNKKELITKSPVVEVMDEVRMALFVNNEDEGQSSPIKSSHQTYPTPIRECSVNIAPLETGRTTPTSIELHPSSTKQSTPNITGISCGQSTPLSTHNSPFMKTLGCGKLQDKIVENKVMVDATKATEVVCENFTQVQSKTFDQDSGVSSSDEHNQQATSGEDTHATIKERRDTYKVIVTEAELPRKSTPQRIHTGACKMTISPVSEQQFKNSENESVAESKDVADENIPTVFSPNTAEMDDPQEIPRKGPKILKPIRAGNIVSGIKSFVKRQDTPKKETEEEKQMKKVAELQRKDLLRQKVMEESHLKKQRMLEQRKRQREDREKRFAEQQARRQEEEERKRQQLEIKARQMSKKREEVTKQREIEEKRKREIREMKKAETDARRQKEEEEQRRKALEQVEEEKRRQELQQRKVEYEEQERLKKRIENGKAEKERLKQIEEERYLYEERKKREFEERELHRLEVDRKMKEEREKERLEKQKREERKKQAEMEIEEARKREQEREKAKERLREEIKLQVNQEKEAKGAQFSCKVVVNAQNAMRNSPSLSKPQFKPPNGNAMSLKSPAAYNAKKPISTYNPPSVPLMIRESSFCSYGIDDLSSDDSTDDECEPAKRIPSWAQGMNLKTQLLQQFYTNINPDLIFINCMEPCRLDKIFQKKKERYFKRTSSAHWTSPILKNNTYQVK